MISSYSIKRWLMFSIVSVFFFLVIGTTYGAIGVILPYMLAELQWSWTQAGIGFTIMALMTGITALIPAWLIRHFSVGVTYLVGGLAMCGGYILLATCSSLMQFYIAAALLGYGFSHCANVPAIHLLNNWMADKRSVAIGAYMTIGGLGGVAGPVMVTSVESIMNSWRAYWWLVLGIMLLMNIIAIVFIRDKPNSVSADKDQAQSLNQQPDEKLSDRVYKTTRNWTYRETIACPQFYIIVAAMTMTLFCTVTMSSWAVVHMGNLGIAAAIAATAMSTQALLNAISRALAGVVSTRIDPKWLLLVALIAEVGGMIGLSTADRPMMIALFVIGEGVGFGMCLFTTTVLLINYFGPKNNPEILGTLNLITTVAMVGPLIAGFVGDAFGSFAIVFQSYAVFLLVIAIAVFLMKPPLKKAPIQ